MTTLSAQNVLITGTNVGIGKETARQLASNPEVKTIYLACRNLAKAETAKKDLEARTGRSIFRLISIDTENLKSVRAAVLQIKELKEPIDTLVMNAGGFGGTTIRFR